MQASIREIKEFYKKKKPDIEKRIKEFKSIRNSGDDKILFSELCFCLLTPQSRALTCWAAVSDLKEKDLLFRGTPGRIKNSLTGVRFKNNKTSYIIRVQKQYPVIKKKIKDNKDVYNLREWLVNNICGFGYKESSHFLRNIGLGTDLAILDRHILKNLKSLEVINEIPLSISKTKYIEIEKKMKRFSDKVKIPVGHLDLLLWAKETGEIFK
ncbi:N-glycosylase/DNA lyase [Elusimicrobiota bacterium]